MSKTPLHQAAMDLGSICEIIDEIDDVPSSLLKVLGELKAELSSSVDRQIMFRKFVESQITAAKALKDEWAHRQKVLENLKENHANYMLATMSGTTLPFKGEQGEIRAQKSPASLIIDIKLDRRSIETVSLDTLEMLQIPQKYVVENHSYSLNKEAIKSDLENGKELSWARIVNNKHIRIYI